MSVGKLISQLTGPDVYESDILHPVRWNTVAVTGEEVETPTVWQELKQRHYGHVHTYSYRRSDPISIEGDMVRIRPEVLVVGKPVAFMYDGVPVMAIKQSDDTVEFYYTPRDD